MDAIEYLRQRKVELEAAKQAVMNQYNAIIGGLAEIDLAIEKIEQAAGQSYDLGELLKVEEEETTPEL